MTTYANGLKKLIEDMGARYWVKSAALQLDDKDPVDAMADVEALLALQRTRLAEAMNGVERVAVLPEFTPPTSRLGTTCVTPEWARKRGFTIDTTVHPWVAYKGPRFNPTEWHACYSDLEARVFAAREALADMIDGADDGNRAMDAAISRVIEILDGVKRP